MACSSLRASHSWQAAAHKCVCVCVCLCVTVCCQSTLLLLRDNKLGAPQHAGARLRRLCASAHEEPSHRMVGLGLGESLLHGPKNATKEENNNKVDDNSTEHAPISTSSSSMAGWLASDGSVRALECRARSAKTNEVNRSNLGWGQ